MSTRLEQIWAQGQSQRSQRKNARRQPPLIRIWDGDWNYRGRIADPIEATFQWRLNETGAAHITLPTKDPLAKWVMDYRGRQTKNVHITMDKDGARWSGRLTTARTIKTSNGQSMTELEFLHDYEELKHILCWPNPYLPTALQVPKHFTLLGPTAWVLKMALQANVWRLNSNIWSLPDDPFDPSSWVGSFDYRDWPIFVMPGKGFLQDTSPWTLFRSRMKSWHDEAHQKLLDAQLMVTCRRWLQDDPPPAPGLQLRHGCLMVDVVDKSGWWSEDGTASRGTVFNGLVRTVQRVFQNVDETQSVVGDPRDLSGYSRPNFFSTEVGAPYVIYREAPVTGVESSEFSWSPATTVQAVCGGQSPYGVNEAISAAVQFAGNALGTMVLLPTAGTIADKFLYPLYADTVLAWSKWRSDRRTHELGWSHYYENFVDGADKGFTVSAALALRRGFWQSREKTAHKLQVADGAPWYIGENGHGHFFLGDRIGAAISSLPDGVVVIEQVTELVYAVSRSERGWKITCGDLTQHESAVEKVIRGAKELAAIAHDLGVN